MSHTHYTYPQTHALSLAHAWQIREEGDNYDTGNSGDKRYTLLEQTDIITERLTRAEALTWMLQESDNPPEQAPKVTAMVILDLIQEIREANEKIWEIVRQEAVSEE